MSLQGKRMCTIDGVDFTPYWVAMEALRPSGPGVVGSCNLYFEKLAGGLTIKNKQVVRLWQAFDGTGAGVAPRGRWLIGLIDGRLTTAKGQMAQWKVAVTDCNILLKHLRIDIDDNKSVTIPAGSFASQIVALSQAVQYQGHGSVNIEIDASNYVEPLVAAGMPAYVAHGKTYGQMLLEICTNARAINQALRPQFYIGVGSTFGVSDPIGNPVLHVWDGAVTPSPLYVFSDAPTGGQKYRYGTPSRSLDSTKVSQRAQAWYSSSQIPATYENTAAQASYPNPFINHQHNPGGNSGSWQALDPAKDTTSTTLGQALSQLQIAVDQVAYPREVYEHGSDSPIMPGEVVTEIDSLEDGLSGGVNYRVVQVAIDVTTDDDPFYTLTLGGRRLELLESGEGILAAPAEGDNTPPLAPTNLTLASQVWQPLLNQYLQTWTWVNSVSRDVDTHRWWDQATIYGVVMLHLEGTYSRYIPPSTAYDVVVDAKDTHDHWSPPSNRVTGTSPAAPALPAPTGLAQSSVYDPVIDKTQLTFTWTPSSDPSVLHQRIQCTVVGGATQETLVAASATQAIFMVPAGATIHQSRVRAENAWTVSAWAPSSAGLADFVVASYLRLPAPPTFSVNSNVYLPDIDEAQLQFIWSTPSDPNGLGIAGYRITINQGGIGYSVTLPVQTSYLALMIPALAFTSTVQAIDGYGHLGAAALVSGTTAGRVHEQLYNPSFEWLERRPGPVSPDGWTLSNGTGNGHVLWDNSQASDGNYSIRFDQLSAGGTPPSIISDYFRVDGSKSYLLDADGRSDASLPADVFEVDYYDVNFAFLGSVSGVTGPNNTTSTWSQQNANGGIFAYPNSRYARLKITGPGGFTAAGQYQWIDNLVFRAEVRTQDVKALAITTPKLADASITAAKLARLDTIGLTTISKTAGFTLDSSATVYLCSSLSPFTATLPTAVGIGGRVYIIKNTGGAAKVTLATTSSQLIDGISTYPLIEKNQVVAVQSDNANWQVIAQAGLVLESDGTRWLGAEELLPMATYLGAQPYSANTEVFACTLDGKNGMLITQFDISYFVYTTNSGLSYWTIELRRLNSGSGTLSMGTLNTSLTAHDTWAHPAPMTSFSNNPTVTGDVWIEVQITKTGTPGNMQMGPPRVAGRKIYT